MLAGWAASAVLRAQPAMMMPDVKESSLDNGLRILVVEDHSEPRVACKILTRFGAVVEEPGRLGSAHYLEHLMFKGTPTIGTTDWNAERPIIDRIYQLEAELVQERNRARNDLKQRGVFLDFAHQPSTPRLDELQAQIRAAEEQDAAFIKTNDSMSYYQRTGGMRITASTEQEYMKFDVNLPSEKIEMFFRVEADRMSNSIWRQFDAERMILWEQRLGDLGRPSTEFRETMASATGAISPIYWNEGYPTDFPLLERAYTRRLYDTWFIPNNTILVFVGDTTLAEVERLARSYFAAIPRGPETHDTLAVEPVHHELIRVEMSTKTYGPAIDVRHRIPGVGHPDRPAIELLAEIIADPDGPIGWPTLGAGLATSLSADTVVTHTDRFSFPSSLNIVERAASADAMAPLEESLVAAVDALRSKPISDAVINRAKKRQRVTWERRKLNWDDLAFDLGHYEIMDSWRTLYRELNALQQLTAEDLRKVSEKYFVRTNRVIGLARPEGAAR